jgi:putative ABC transport system permease protein
MNPLPDILERLKALFFSGRLERELDEELSFHVARDAEARARSGSIDASREALAALGGLERVKEEVRAARGVLPVQELVADTRYALRSLRRNAGLTLTVVAVLGLGLGAATAVFTVVNRVLLTGLPYRDPGRLVRIYQQNSPTNLWSLSVVDVQAIAEQQHTLEAFGAARYGSASLAGIAAPERVAVGRLTSGFFRALGVNAAQGRLVGPEDDRPGAPAIVVVSHRLAERALGGAPSAVGRSITIDGVSHVVVGVLEPGRNELAGMEAEAWPNLRVETPTRRGPFGLRGVARLKKGITLAQAARDLAGISERIFPIWASGFQDRAARLVPVPLRDAVIGRANGQVGLFAGAVGLVLLLAVANVATLMLVRTSAREHEVLVRSALGAGRHRLARLIVTEGTVLTVLAGAVGVGIAAISLRIVGLVAPNLPRLAEVALDPSSLAFAAVVTLVTGVLITLAPLSSVLACVSSVGSSSLASAPARSGTGRRTTRIRGALVAAEFALALPLLVGAGLLLNSFLRLQHVDPGFDPRGVYSLALSLPGSPYRDEAAVRQFWQLAEMRAAEIAGVTAVGLSGSIPPDNGGDVNNFDLLDKPVPAGTAQPVAPWSAVTPGYFTALGIPLLEGRLLTLADSGSSPPVVVVSRAWAARYYRGASAVGKELHSGGCTACPPTTVVGVVGDVPYLGLANEAEGVYAPLAQEGGRSLHLVVRSGLGSAATFRALRSAVASLDPDLAPVEVDLSDHLRRSLGDPRRWTFVVGAFAATGVLLAALGVFGLMSYVVRQRRREMGIRLALGASPHALTRLVVQRGMRYPLLGTSIGLGLAALESRWLGSLLFGVRATDPITLVSAVGLLLAVAAIACWVPGLRAARLKPLEVLASD